MMIQIEKQSNFERTNENNRTHPVNEFGEFNRSLSMIYTHTILSIVVKEKSSVVFFQQSKILYTLNK